MNNLVPSDTLWLDRLRRAASTSFEALGWPSRALEDWRYSDLEPIAETDFAAVPALANADKLTALLAAQAADADLLVFVNGQFSPGYSRIGALPSGVFLGSFARWAAEYPDAAAPLLQPIAQHAQALTDLNTGAFSDGLALIVPEGTALSRPVEAVYWTESNDPAAVHSRGHIALGAGSEACVLENWAGHGPYWNNAVLSVALAAQSKLRLTTLQNETLAAFHTAAVGITLQEAASFDGFQLTLGGANVRREYRASLQGPMADFTLNGTTLLSGRQSAATVTILDHTAAGYVPALKQGTTSSQTFKIALADRAHAAFQGRIVVHPGAQKTDAAMLNKTVLLSDRAVIDTKPELEIYADDVKCSHGASVGDLDEAALFYLVSRGIEPEAARRILIDAFVTEPIDRVTEPRLAEVLRKAVAARLADLKG